MKKQLILLILIPVVSFIAACSTEVDRHSENGQFTSSLKFSCSGLKSKSPFVEVDRYTSNGTEGLVSILIKIAEDGQIIWNGQQISRNGFSMYARQISKKSKDVELIIQIQEGAPCLEIAYLMRTISTNQSCKGRRCIFLPWGDKGPRIN